MWAPGTLVVHVLPNGLAPWRNWENAHYPTVGCIYTIRGSYPEGRKVLLLLEEIWNGHLIVDGKECGFNSRYFRPVSPVHKQIIRDLLVPVPDPDLIVEEGIDAVLRERLGAG